MVSRAAEYERRMRALGYQNSLDGMDDEDIEEALTRMDGVRAKEPEPQGFVRIRPGVDRDFAERMFRRFSRPFDPNWRMPDLDGPGYIMSTGPIVGVNRAGEGAGGVAPRAREADGDGIGWSIDPLGMFPQYQGGESSPEVKKRIGLDVGNEARVQGDEASNPFAGGYADGGAEGDMLIPPTEVKLWKGENPNWDDLQPKMKDTTTAFIGDINKAFGTNKTPWVTSGYRSPEFNASLPEASPNSWHLQGLGVDINLDDYTAEERAKIEAIARKRFEEVYWHKGTGWHLHIGNPLTNE